MLEVAMDVVSGNGMEVLKRARLGEYGVLHIAETGMSIFLDGARRQYWDEQDAPPRPQYPPRHLLERKDGFATEPLPVRWGDAGGSDSQYRARMDAQYARDAAAQIAWEAEALRDWEERRAREADRSPSPSGGEGEAPPGAEGEGPPPEPRSS